MKNLLATVALAATTLTSGVAAAQDGPDLVTIITSPEPQTQLMALVLTFQAAQQGANAHIMLSPRCCLTASAWPHPTRWPHASWMPIPVS
jgi:hypothetical protein